MPRKCINPSARTTACPWPAIDGLWPEIQAGRLALTDVEADAVHPNDQGHDYAAKFIIHLLQMAAETVPENGKHAKIAALPAPKTPMRLNSMGMLNAKTLKPAQNSGWEEFTDPGFGPFFGTRLEKRYTKERLGADVKGRAISLLFYRIKGATGIAEATVDNGPPVKMDAWFDQTWGGYTPLQLVARDLAPGTHRVKIRFLKSLFLQYLYILKVLVHLSNHINYSNRVDRRHLKQRLNLFVSPTINA